MMSIPFVDLTAQYRSIRSEIDSAIARVIEETAFVGGKHLADFETHFAEYIGAKHCIGVGNGTDALIIALKALGIVQGDEVITVANSFIATSEAITAAGAQVVFVDCRKDTYNIDVELLERKITKRTKVIIPVHLYGHPAEMDRIMAIARTYGLKVIEDAAQAHGAEFQGKRIGTWGDCASFSFFPGKNLGAYGDAGALVTNDDSLAKRIRMYANHGRIEKYNHEFEGINSRLDGLQAAILDVKLKHLETWTERRRTIARAYDAGLKDAVTIPVPSPDCRHVYHLYVIRVPHRERVAAFLKARGISTGIHYPIPLPFLKAYHRFGFTGADFPAANEVKDLILSLPIHGDMNDEQTAYVIAALREAVATAGR